MRIETRQKYEEYAKHIGDNYGVADVSKRFAVIEPMGHKLEAKIMESSVFLQKITIVPVIERKGQKIVIDIGSIASTKDTSGGSPRVPKGVPNLAGYTYDCTQTNYDTFVSYDMLDSMAHFPDFKTKLRDQKTQRVVLDRIKIGFYGESRSDSSDIVANPNLEDVNVGWKQYVINNAPEQILVEGATAGEIRVGAGGDYETIDEIIVDMRFKLIGDEHRSDGDLVVLIGSDLLHSKLNKLYSQSDKAQEYQVLTQMGDLVQMKTMLGGLPTFTHGAFKPRGLWITSLKNLAIYIQQSGKRMMVKENPEYDRIDDFLSSNECYIVQLLKKFAAIEEDNVLLEGEWTTTP